MHDSVNSQFPIFSTKFEGRVAWMYCDILGLVTIGVGNLIDPEEAAVGLPFVHKADQSPATTDEIRSEWRLLKGRSADLGKKGHRACESITALRLTESAIDDLVRSKVHTNETFLKKTFPDFDEWPADAQLGMLSMAWAMGPAFTAKWPGFTKACIAHDWTAAAANCRMNETGNPGIVPRNNADVLLFSNAAVVAASGGDVTTLWWPESAPASAAPAPVEDGQWTAQESTDETSQSTDDEAAVEEATSDQSTTDASLTEETTTDETTTDETTSEDATDETTTDETTTDETTTDETTSEDASTDDSSSEESSEESSETTDGTDSNEGGGDEFASDSDSSSGEFETTPN